MKPIVNVLLVDDDPICSLLSRKLLQGMSATREIDVATSGAEAIKLVNQYVQSSQKIPDIILLDLNMPIMDGFGFIEAFKRLPPDKTAHVKIIVVTSSLDEGDMKRVKDLGIEHYLTKPISEAELIAALQLKKN